MSLPETRQFQYPEPIGPEPFTMKSWLTEFNKTHDSAKLPETLRESWSDFLQYRASIVEFYNRLPAKYLDNRIGEGWSLREEMVHMIENSGMRRHGLQTGDIPAWSYEKLNPQEHERLFALSSQELATELETETSETYRLYTDPEILNKKVLQPEKKGVRNEVTGRDLLKTFLYHDIRHQSFTIKFRDELHLPLPSQKVYGG